MSHSKSNGKYLRTTLEILLIIGLAVGTTYLVTVALENHYGSKNPLVVISNRDQFGKCSMSETYEFGDLLVIKKVPADEIKVGDVIVFNNPDSSEPIIHRVVYVNNTDSENYYYLTKGDNNRQIDLYWIAEGYPGVPYEEVHGVVVHRVPWVGRISLALQGTAGIILLISIIFVILLFLIVLEGIEDLETENENSESNKNNKQGQKTEGKSFLDIFRKRSFNQKLAIIGLIALFALSPIALRNMAADSDDAPSVEILDITPEIIGGTNTLSPENVPLVFYVVVKLHNDGLWQHSMKKAHLFPTFEDKNPGYTYEWNVVYTFHGDKTIKAAVIFDKNTWTYFTTNYGLGNYNISVTLKAFIHDRISGTTWTISNTISNAFTIKVES